MFLVFVALISGLLSLKSISLAFILVGICSAYQILAIYKVSTYVEEQLVGLTTAIANMIIMSFGYAFHTVIGAVIKRYGGFLPLIPLVMGFLFPSLWQSELLALFL